MNMNSYNCCLVKEEGFKKIGRLLPLLKLIGVSNRLQILCILSYNEHCVCEINKYIKSSQSLVSHHLKDLKNGGLIEDRKEGLNVFYSLTPEGKRITDIIFEIYPKESKK